MKNRVAVLFGTETGNSQECAEALAAAIVAAGIPAEAIDMGEYPGEELARERLAFIVTSTFGNGDPPANAQVLFDHVSDAATRLDGLRYGVCALGDSTYPLFAQCGKDFDERLELRGAQRVVERVDCDGGFDFEVPFENFKERALAYLAQHWAQELCPEDAPGDAPHEPVPSPEPANGSAATVCAPPPWTRQHPFDGRLLVRRRLSGPGSAKETFHYAVGLEGSGIHYTPGDCFGVYPSNDPNEVGALLDALELDPDAVVLDRGESAPLGDVLVRSACLQRITLDLLRALSGVPGPATELLARPERLHDYAPAHHVLDLVREHPGAQIAPQGLVDALRRVAPRLYSIASSQRAHPGEVHFTIDTVRYARHGRPVLGVASTWFAERLDVGAPVPLYLHPNERFRLPDDDRPIVMIGPGTGIAPFRAFLEELRATDAKNPAWLFFGHQHEAHDFLYRDELMQLQAEGVLDRLSLAWSRDQAQKVYVQQRIRENARDVWDWLARGANLYVCGDAAGMAPAVRAALADVVRTQGGSADPEAWLRALEADHRYSQDVY